VRGVWHNAEDHAERIEQRHTERQRVSVSARSPLSVSHPAQRRRGWRTCGDERQIRLGAVTVRGRDGCVRRVDRSLRFPVHLSRPSRLPVARWDAAVSLCLSVGARVLVLLPASQIPPAHRPTGHKTRGTRRKNGLRETLATHSIMRRIAENLDVKMDALLYYTVAPSNIQSLLY